MQYTEYERHSGCQRASASNTALPGGFILSSRASSLFLYMMQICSDRRAHIPIHQRKVWSIVCQASCFQDKATVSSLVRVANRMEVAAPISTVHLAGMCLSFSASKHWGMFRTWRNTRGEIGMENRKVCVARSTTFASDVRVYSTSIPAPNLMLTGRKAFGPLVNAFAHRGPCTAHAKAGEFRLQVAVECFAKRLLSN